MSVNHFASSIKSVGEPRLRGALRGKSQVSTTCCDSSSGLTQYIHTESTLPAKPPTTEWRYLTRQNGVSRHDKMHTPDAWASIHREKRDRDKVVGDWLTSRVDASPEPEHALVSRCPEFPPRGERASGPQRKALWTGVLRELF